MPWKHQLSQAVIELLPVFISLIMGMLGGAAVAGSHLLARKIDRMVYVLAYVVIGAGFGAAVVLGSFLVPLFHVETVSQAAVLGLMSGVFGVAAVAAGNFSVALAVKRLGLTVNVEVKDRQGNSKWSNTRKGAERDDSERD